MTETRLCVVRGGGDVATGVIWRLTKAGWNVIVTELAAPLTVRRPVAVSTAIHEGHHVVEGMRAQRCVSIGEAVDVAMGDSVAVMVSATLPDIAADVVVDARIAKHNIDTCMSDAPLVVALGPGFVAGEDCHAVVETMRGHHLGRLFWSGSAAPNTGTPGLVGGRGADRVLRAPTDGVVSWTRSIGDRVSAGDTIGAIGGTTISAPFEGLVRGLIMPGMAVPAGLKVGDIDPRCDAPACFEISDKALAVGGGVVEAVSTWMQDPGRATYHG